MIERRSGIRFQHYDKQNEIITEMVTEKRKKKKVELDSLYNQFFYAS